MIVDPREQTSADPAAARFAQRMIEPFARQADFTRKLQGRTVRRCGHQRDVLGQRAAHDEAQQLAALRCAHEIAGAFGVRGVSVRADPALGDRPRSQLARRVAAGGGTVGTQLVCGDLVSDDPPGRCRFKQQHCENG